jgi:hypothetical protein
MSDIKSENYDSNKIMSNFKITDFTHYNAKENLCINIQKKG